MCTKKVNNYVIRMKFSGDFSSTKSLNGINIICTHNSSTLAGGNDDDDALYHLFRGIYACNIIITDISIHGVNLTRIFIVEFFFFPRAHSYTQ